MRNIVVGTAGHIDHGKSTLVRALTGVDPDRLKEEKTRGITIDLGFAHYHDDEVDVAFVDVPGHERFVRNMLAGATGIDGVLLVVAADESVMPQTREHFDICRLLGVDRGLIALTKTDLVDQETQDVVRLDVAELVEGSFLESAPVVPVSARTGLGLDVLRRELARLGAAAQIDAAGTGGAGREEPGRPRVKAAAQGSAAIVRLPVDRAFTMKGFGTVVTGTLASGAIGAGDELEVLPAGRRVKVRGVQLHGESQARVSAGHRVAVNVAGIDVDELRRGDTLVSPGGLEVSRRADATVVVLPGAGSLKHGARVRVHAGTAEVMARIMLCGTPDRDGEPSGALEPGAAAYGRLRLEAPVVLTRGDRFVLRAYSPPVTVGGGRVLDPSPARGRFRSAAGLVRLQRLERWDDDGSALAVMVAEAGARGLDRARVTPRTGISPDAVSEVVDGLTRDGSIEAMGDVLIATAHARRLRQLLTEWVAGFHTAHPLEPGLSREEARERLSRHAHPGLFGALVEQLVGEGVLVAQEHLALTSHRIDLTDEERHVRDALAGRFRDAGLAPPDVANVARDAGWPAVVVDRMLKLLVREGTLTRLESLVFHTAVLERLKADIRSLPAASGQTQVEIDVPTFKTHYGVTRKFAIPLLAYLDRERVTRRVGNLRIVL